MRGRCVGFVVAVAVLAGAPAAEAVLKISELRLRGAAGVTDEIVELHNDSKSSLTVQASDGSAGWALAGSDGVIRATLPNGLIIPAHGHYLLAGAGYGLAAYPAGSGLGTMPDLVLTGPIPTNMGVALFSTALPAAFSVATRIDAAGATTELNPLYREGAGYPAITDVDLNGAFFRDEQRGSPQDTNDNAVDFVWADADGTNTPAGRRLGAPGPENSTSPRTGGTRIAVDLLDPDVGPGVAPNLIRDLTSDAANNSTFGTIDLRRRIVNTSAVPITRLRFRLTDMTTFLTTVGDLRARTSGAAGPVAGTTVETPPLQPNGGGLNASMSVDAVTPNDPLDPGETISVRFLFGVQQNGPYRVCAITEGQPPVFGVLAQTGHTLTGDSATGCLLNPGEAGSGGGGGQPTPTPTATPTASPTATPTPEPRPQPGCALTVTQTIGTPENDEIDGDERSNTIFGLEGNDALDGKRDDDCLYGDVGNDLLIGGRGSDRLFGGVGNDALHGEGGPADPSIGDGTEAGDRLHGGPGDDSLLDARKRATLRGGPGNDRLNTRDALKRDRPVRDRIFCGPGRDVAIADAADKLAGDCEQTRIRGPNRPPG